MKKYLAYVRVSTVKQGERGSSLQEQRSAIEAFAQRQGLTVTTWFEETETAAKQGRRIFSRMLRLLEHGEADGVVIHKIDRSARNLKDWANLGELIDRGIDVQFVHDSVDLRSRGGRLSADIQAVVAADYIRNLRDEVRKGFYGRLKQGLYPLPAPIGYLDRGPGKPKELDPVRAPLVRQAFELYSTATVGLKKLRIELNRRGLRSRSGKPLSLTGLSTMLNNPFYMGLIRIRRTNETFEGVHQPLISKALFDRVQAILRGKTVSRSVKYDFVFRRFVRCASCKYHLIGERQKGHVYYRCHSEGCKGTCIREEVLDEVVQSALKLLVFDTKEMQELSALADEAKTRDVGDTEKLRASINMRLVKCEERMVRLTDALVDRLIDKELFESRKLALFNEKRELADQLERLCDSEAPANVAFKNLELGNVAYSGYKEGIPLERRAIIESVTSNLVAQRKNPVIKMKSPFQEIINWRKSLNGAPYRGDTRTRMKQLLAILTEGDNKT